jgi:hypothetical protein
MLACLVHLHLNEDGIAYMRAVYKTDKPEEFLETWESVRKTPDSQFFVYTTRAHSPTEDFLGIDSELVKKSKDGPTYWNLTNSQPAHLWCPYCEDSRNFYYDPRMEVHCCGVCQVSVNEYYVRRHNGVD